MKLSEYHAKALMEQGIDLLTASLDTLDPEWNKHFTDAAEAAKFYGLEGMLEQEDAPKDLNFHDKRVNPWD